MLLGFDISTSVIGFSAFNLEGELVELDCVKFKDKQSIFEKLAFFEEKIKHYKSAEIKYIGIEEPLKKFSGRFSNADTISKLNFFNGMISSYLYLTFKVEPQYLNVSTARKTSFPELNMKTPEIKHEVWKKVVECEPQINWKYSKITGKLMDENYDMSDSYVISRSYLKILNDRNDVQLKEGYFNKK